jgi:hypothetical protein
MVLKGFWDDPLESSLLALHAAHSNGATADGMHSTETSGLHPSQNRATAKHRQHSSLWHALPRSAAPSLGCHYAGVVQASGSPQRYPNIS